MVGVNKAGHIRTKLTEMAMTAETVYGLSLAAGTEGFKHPSGFWIPNPLMSHTCKYTCTKAPFEAMRYARDIIAGFGETAPSELDMRSEGVGAIVQRAFNPGNPEYDAFDRLRATRFIEAHGPRARTGPPWPCTAAATRRPRPSWPAASQTGSICRT